MKKNVLLTGATGGIGKAICSKLKNYNLVVVSRNEEKLKNFMKDNKLIIKRITCDLKDPTQITKMIEEVISSNLNIDILVNNAGVTDDSLFIRMNYEKWQNVIRTNLDSNFLLTNSISKLMIKKKWGRIINISSMEGKHGKPIVTAYTTAKHAINGMTKSVAREVGTEGVTVNAICPGLIVTDILQTNGPKTAEAMGMTLDEMIDYFTSESAIKRPNKVEEVAAVALLLASEAGAGITGTQLSVDGGTAQY